MKTKQQSGYFKWLAAVMVLFATGALADEEQDSYLTMMLGYESTSGKYGAASTTDIVTIPVSALYETGRWAMKLTVPYLQVTGEGDVIASGGGRGGRTTSTTLTTIRTTRSGLGDVAAMLTYNVYAAEDVDAGIDLAGRVKFGTASKTLGTGMNDYAAQLYAYRAIGDFTPSIILGYEVLGSSAEVPLDNVYYGTVAGDYRFGELTNGGVEYRYAQKASVTAAEQREAVLYANRQVGRDTYLRGYLLKGYSDGSPESGYGVVLSVVY